MAIDRRLLSILVTFTDDLGTVKTESSEIVTDDVEGTSAGRIKNWNANAVLTAAAALRDAVTAQATQQGKPMHF